MRWIKRNSSRFPLFFFSVLYSVFFAWGLCRHAFRGLLVSLLTPLVVIPVACIHLLYAALSLISLLLFVFIFGNFYNVVIHTPASHIVDSMGNLGVGKLHEKRKKTRNIYAFLFDEVLSTNDDLTD
jgi:hypothetical protein